MIVFCGLVAVLTPRQVPREMLEAEKRHVCRLHRLFLRPLSIYSSRGRLPLASLLLFLLLPKLVAVRSARAAHRKTGHKLIKVLALMLPISSLKNMSAFDESIIRKQDIANMFKSLDLTSISAGTDHSELICLATSIGFYNTQLNGSYIT